MANFREVLYQYRNSMQTDAVWNKLYGLLSEFTEKEREGDAVIFSSDGSPVTGIVMKNVLEEIRKIRVDISKKMSEYDNTQIGKMEKKDGKSEGAKNNAGTGTGSKIRRVGGIRRHRNPDAQKGDG